MVDHHVVGRGTAGSVRYAFEGRRDTPADKQPYLLGWRGVGTSSIEEMIADFEIGQQANQRLDNVVWHVSLSFNPDDTARLDNRKMLEIAEVYLEKMGMAQTQYIIVRHHDTAHQHLHIIASRVDDAGKTVADGQNFIRSKDKLKELIEQHGLTPSQGLRPELQHPEKLHGTELIRGELRQVIRQKLVTATTLPDLTASLQGQGLDVRYRLNQAGEPTGISFAKNKIACRGGELGKDYSLAGIERQLAANLAKQQAVEAERQGQQQQVREREKQRQQLQEKTAVALERQLPGATNLEELQRRLFLTELLHTQVVIGADGQLEELLFNEVGKSNCPVQASELALPYQPASLQQTLDQQRAAWLEAEQRQAAEAARLEVERQQAAARQLAEQQAAARRAAAQRAAEATQQANQWEAERKAAEQDRQEAARYQVESWRDQLREQAKQLTHLMEQAQQAELVGDYGRVAQLRYGDIPELQLQRDAVEQQAAATASGQAMLAELRMAEAAATQAAKQPPLEVATPITDRTEEATRVATAPAVTSTEQVDAAIKVIEAARPASMVTPAQTALDALLGIDWEVRFQQYDKEQTSTQRHNAAVDYVGYLLKRESGAKPVAEALAYAQTDRAPFLEKAQLVLTLQRELKRQQEHEEWVQGVREHKADLEVRAKKWSGLSSKAMAAQNELADLRIPGPLKVEVYLPHYIQPELVKLSQGQFIQQQQQVLTQLGTKITAVLTEGITSWDSFHIRTESEGVKIKRSPDNQVTFYLEKGKQAYRAAEVLPDFAARFSCGLERGLQQQTQQRTQESTKSLQVER